MIFSRIKYFLLCVRRKIKTVKLLSYQKSTIATFAKN